MERVQKSDSPRAFTNRVAMEWTLCCALYAVLFSFLDIGQNRFDSIVKTTFIYLKCRNFRAD